jgi:hypothetical protein
MKFINLSDMKAINHILILVIGALLFSSCSEYLEKTPEATVTEEDVFGTYESFQGFMDANYGEVVNYNTHYATTTANMGGESLNNFISWSPAYTTWNGDYWYIAGADDYSFNDFTSLYMNGKYGYGIFYDSNGGKGGGGIWTGGWRGIRRCNVALEHLDQLSDATEEEKRLIEAQIYFFRAYFHHQIIDAFGGMPYIDKVYSPNEDVRLDRLTYHECAERIVEDYDKAISLLPVDWDNTVVGGQRPGANTGRATKGAAMAYKAKVLLYAGSPLMNKFSGKDYSYNLSYCERAAAAGWDLIQLVRSTGIYELQPFDNMLDMYARNDGTQPWSKETIWQQTRVGGGYYDFESYIRRQYCFARLGGRYCEQVNQLFVDKFEMADGTRYKIEYDNDNALRWDFRDPRFRKNIIIDREQHGYDERSIIYLYEGEGSDKTPQSQVSLPYLIKKFWPVGANGFDKDFANLCIISPLLRLAEVYLDYAEAVTAAYGPTGTAPGADLTAVDALNIVRDRAGMPPVTAAATEYPSFMDLVWNERNVELCFEGHYWYDTRRWHTAHLNLECVDLAFDKDWTTFTRSVIKTKVFEDPKHYWLPLNRDQVLIYPGFYQNPGWE